jgi:DNA-binding NtrC family response regulator
LNDRREDIPVLVEHFAAKIASEHGSVTKKFTKKALELLKKYNWTGNIRELRNVVERLIILGGTEITEEDVTLFAGK